MGELGRRSLRIAVVAAPWFEVLPQGYGGIEAVCAGLVDGLGARGHRVTPIGAGRDLTAADFVATFAEPPSARLGEAVPEVLHSAVAVAAIFISNVPEGLSSSAGMKKAKRSPGHIFGLCGAIAVVPGVAALTGFGIFSNFSAAVIAATTAVAAGAILAMLADTMIPEAFEYAHNLTGLVTRAGSWSPSAEQARVVLRADPVPDRRCGRDDGRAARRRHHTHRPASLQRQSGLRR